jgi:hypothetical protein
MISSSHLPWRDSNDAGGRARVCVLTRGCAHYKQPVDGDRRQAYFRLPRLHAWTQTSRCTAAPRRLMCARQLECKCAFTGIVRRRRGLGPRHVPSKLRFA